MRILVAEDYREILSSGTGPTVIAVTAPGCRPGDTVPGPRDEFDGRRPSA